MSTQTGFTSVFDQPFDVIVFGAGYAGLAASRCLSQAGKSVLLIDRLGDAAWESGRAMSEHVGHTNSPDFQLWLNQLSAHGALNNNLIPPGPAEVLASHELSALPNLRILYYASPIDVTLHDGMLSAVTLATKSGLRRVVARQFLDTTETGELICLFPNAPAPRTPARNLISLFFLSHQWADAFDHPLACPALPDASLLFTRSAWPNVRKLLIDLPGSESHPRAAWLPALQALRDQLPILISGAVLTHGSVIPLPIYSNTDLAPQTSLPANVACASPACVPGTFASLSSRFMLGSTIAAQLLSQPAARIDTDAFKDPIPTVTPRRTLTADIAIAGLGTGGLLAAIAAGRHNPSTLAFDPFPFAGGIGTGGGIHVYYHGVKGGLQQELDDLTRQIMPLFGEISQVRGFHPDAKKIAADTLLRRAGVTPLTGSLTAVTTHCGTVQSALISTPEGPLLINAKAWIDSTGDGDLASLAGASYQLGRAPDGQLHAFSQSSGRAGLHKGFAQMYCMNYDAGFVDPTDPEDLTRARLLGIGHYLFPCYSPDDHPTYIAPAIGLRQARHFDTDYTLTLADIIERRRFPDCIGYTGCHYDNHAVDYELETDEPLFWVWVCRQWRGRTACEIPYRILLPQSLNNVWIACRALGVSFEAHSSMRMQRDLQRVGEVAGLAAALAVKHAEPFSSSQVSSRSLPFDALHALLAQSGAVKLTSFDEDTFGSAAQAAHFSAPINLSDPASLISWSKTLQQTPNPQSELWYLYRAGPTLAEHLVAPLIHSPDANASFNAAAILAMWGDSRAQPRLIHAIDTREYGYDSLPAAERPERYAMAVPRWMAAVALLRICGDAACLSSLHTLAADPGLILNVRTSIAVTCQRITQRVDFSSTDRALIGVITDHLLATHPPVTMAPPRRIVINNTVQTAVSGRYWEPIVLEDAAWQMHLQVAQARIAIGLTPHADALALLSDPRAIVRRAIASTLAKAPLAVHAS